MMQKKRCSQAKTLSEKTCTMADGAKQQPRGSLSEEACLWRTGGSTRSGHAASEDAPPEPVGKAIIRLVLEVNISSKTMP
jgi:hypothetical protein